MPKPKSSRGVLGASEPHPLAEDAMRYVLSLNPVYLSSVMEALASCAIEGNRSAEICGETLRRLLAGEPVSDRYLLGLAWSLRTGMARDERAMLVALLEGLEIRDVEAFLQRTSPEDLRKLGMRVLHQSRGTK